MNDARIVFDGWPGALFAAEACFETGLGVKKHARAALQELLKTANQGFVPGSRAGPEEAFKWYKKASDAGNASAMTLIGKDDRKEALGWYKAAGEAGNRSAKCVVATVLAALDENWNEAVPLMKEAAQEKDPNAGRTLGIWYMHGLGVKETRTKPSGDTARPQKPASPKRRLSMRTAIQGEYGVGTLRNGRHDPFPARHGIPESSAPCTENL